MKYSFLLLTFLALLSCAKQNENANNNSKVNIFFKENIKEISPGVPAPDFSLQNIEGESISLSDYKGKVILLNFWASWCGPCIAEMPSIENLHKTVKDENIQVVTINLGESKDVVSNFMSKNGYSFNSLLDSDNSVAGIYGIRSIPTTYIINKEGNIVASKLGSHEWDSEGVISILRELNK